MKNIIRITSDCPFVDSKLVKNMKKVYLANKLDYIANTYPPTKSRFPDGSDIEIFKFKSLLKLSKLSKKKEDKEHVTNLFWKNPHIFKTKMINKKRDLSHYKYSVDYKSDLILVKRILKKIQTKKIYGTADEIVNIIKNDIKLKQISEMSRQKFIKNRKDLINFI